MLQRKPITITWSRSRTDKSIFEGTYVPSSGILPGTATGKFNGQLPVVELHVRLFPDKTAELSGGGLLRRERGSWREARGQIHVEM